MEIHKTLRLMTVVEFLTMLDQFYAPPVTKRYGPNGKFTSKPEDFQLISSRILKASRRYPEEDSRNLAARMNEPIPEALYLVDKEDGIFAGEDDE